jgi:thymidylate synthase (FAD)
MKETTPHVYLLMRPRFDWDAAETYLKQVGGKKWINRVDQTDPETKAMPSEGEVLVEFAGRLCYRSWDVGLNPNITKVREDSQEYFTNLLKSGHGSVLEHASYTFLFQDVSRVFTHELVRHRAGVAISQESLRYVRLTELGFRIPPALEDNREQIITVVEAMEEFQKKVGARLDSSNIPFSEKKVVTSALRRLAPLGLSTSILWTANIRTLRHVISMRTAKGAEEEIRLVFRVVASQMKLECPKLFADYKENADGEYVTPYWKV